MNPDQIPVLFSTQQINERLGEIVQQINHDYRESSELLVVCILQGSFLFSTDLVRKMSPKFVLDFMEISSYRCEKKSSGKIQLIRDLQHEARNRDVLIVEDIVDTGATLNFIYDHLGKHEPRSIETAALLVKKKSQEKSPPVRYSGFVIDDLFAVGCGMDYK